MFLSTNEVKIKNMENTLHKNHRIRLRAKALNGLDGLDDHEVLELILFLAQPRVNTNPTAHLLLKTFGTLRKVMLAPMEELCAVKGVGKTTAIYLKTIWELYKRCMPENNKPLEKVYSFDAMKENLIQTFSKYDKEVLITYYIAKNMQISDMRVSGDNVIDSVSVNLEEFTRDIVFNNPAYVIIAHNHMSGNPHPSENDLKTTEKLCLLLTMNNVKLLDHIIVSGRNVFSFYHENVLDGIYKSVAQSLNK